MQAFTPISGQAASGKGQREKGVSMANGPTLWPMLEKEQLLRRDGRCVSMQTCSSHTINISNNYANSGKAAEAKLLHL